MQLKEIYEIADGLAPFSLSRAFVSAYGYRDNSGTMLDCGEDVRGVLFSLDLSREAIAAAKKAGANLVFTHHPAIWNPVFGVTEEAAPLLCACVREGISVISAHLNLDAAPGGIDESLMRGLGGKEAIALSEPVEGGGYGRVYDVPPESFEAFVARAKKTFRTERAVCYGNAPVRRVASFCGAGFDESVAAFALERGADTLVSSDGKHHVIADAVEKGLNVLLLPHYASENYGFRAFFSRMRERLGVPCEYFEDARLL